MNDFQIAICKQGFTVSHKIKFIEGRAYRFKAIYSPEYKIKGNMPIYRVYAKKELIESSCVVDKTQFDLILRKFI